MKENFLNPIENKKSEATDRRRGRFGIVDENALENDKQLVAFLKDATCKPSKRGDGVFIGGCFEVDSSGLRKYGIPVQGALIIPCDPENLQDEIERIRTLISSVGQKQRESEDDLLKKDLEHRKELEKEYEQKIQALLARYNLDGFDFVVEDEGYSARAERNGYLYLDGKKCIFLFSETEPYHDFGAKRFQPWNFRARTIEEVEELLKQEAEFKPTREKFLDKIIDITERTKNWDEDISWRCGVKTEGISESSSFSEAMNDVSILGAHRLVYQTKKYEINQDDLDLLDQEVSEVEKRQEKIWQAFVANNFSAEKGTRRFDTPGYSKRSWASGKIVDDGGGTQYEDIYFIEGLDFYISHKDYQALLRRKQESEPRAAESLLSKDMHGVDAQSDEESKEREGKTEKAKRKFRILKLPKRVLLTLEHNKPYGEYLFSWEAAQVDARPFMPRGLTRRQRDDWQAKVETMWENVKGNDLSVWERYALEEEIRKNIDQLNTAELIILSEILPTWAFSLISGKGFNHIKGKDRQDIFAPEPNKDKLAVRLDELNHVSNVESSFFCKKWIQRHWHEVESAVNLIESMTLPEKKELLKKLHKDIYSKSPWAG